MRERERERERERNLCVSKHTLNRLVYLKYEILCIGSHTGTKTYAKSFGILKI